MIEAALRGELVMRDSMAIDSRFPVHHPGREALEKMYETGQVLRRKMVRFRGAVQNNFEAAQPFLPVILGNGKFKVAGPHHGIAIKLLIQRRAAEKTHQECGNFLRRLGQVGRKQMADRRRLNLGIKIFAHAENIFLAH